MATLLEVHDLFGHGQLLQKVSSAVAIVAFNIMQETTGPNLTARQAWAVSALASPGEEGRRTWIYVLAANSGLTVAQIIAATDAEIQTKVEESVDKRFGASS